MIATFTKSRTFASRFTSRGFESCPVLCVDSIFHIVGMRSVKRRKPKGKPMGTVRQSHGNVELAANTLLIFKTKRLNAIKQFQDKLHHP